MGGGRSCRRNDREVLLPCRNLPRLLDPVLAERALHAADDRSADAHRDVAPVVLVLRVSGPLLCDAEAADVADVSIDDDELAVIAIVHPSEVADAEGMELADLHAGVAHDRF